jgi:hypothetical protein
MVGCSDLCSRLGKNTTTARIRRPRESGKEYRKRIEKWNPDPR